MQRTLYSWLLTDVYGLSYETNGPNLIALYLLTLIDPLVVYVDPMDFCEWTRHRRTLIDSETLFRKATVVMSVALLNYSVVFWVHFL